MSGVKSSLYLAWLILIFPSSENASPCLPSLVGNTQSNMSNQNSIAWVRSSGVPTHIRYLGLSLGSLGHTNSTTSRTSSLLSHTLTHHTAIPSRAYCDKKSIDCSLRSKYVPHCTIGNKTPRAASYFFSKCSNALLAQRCVICICFSTTFLSALPGEHTSNTIIISDHKLHWISTTPSGVNICLDPSYGERNFTPSSVNFIFTSCWWLSLIDSLPVKGGCPSSVEDRGVCLSSSFPRPSENTWNPQLSVNIKPGQFSNLCSHQAFLTNSSPGRKYKWNVFARINLIIGKSPIYFVSWSISRTIPLIVALVPTGIKIGVCSVTPLRVISQTLAFPTCLSILNLSLFMSYKKSKRTVNYKVIRQKFNQ